MQLRGPLVGPDRWWYHTLLKGTVRDTLASYGSVPESGPPLSFDQRVLEPSGKASTYMNPQRLLQPKKKEPLVPVVGKAAEIERAVLP